MVKCNQIFNIISSSSSSSCLQSLSLSFHDYYFHFTFLLFNYWRNSFLHSNPFTPSGTQTHERMWVFFSSNQNFWHCTIWKIVERTKWNSWIGNVLGYNCKCGNKWTIVVVVSAAFHLLSFKRSPNNTLSSNYDHIFLNVNAI